MATQIQLYIINKTNTGNNVAIKDELKQIQLGQNYHFDFESIYKNGRLRKPGNIEQIQANNGANYFFNDATTGKRHRINVRSGALDNLYLEYDMRSSLDEEDNRSIYRFIYVDSGDEKKETGGKRKRKRKSRKRKRKRKSRKRKSRKRKRTRKKRKRA